MSKGNEIEKCLWVLVILLLLSYGLLLMLNNPDDNLDKRIFSELGITICENIPIFLN